MMKKRIWKSLLCGVAAVTMLLPTGCAKQPPDEEPSYHYELKDVTLDENALYNGIVIPENWDFVFQKNTGERITAPYLIEGSGYTAEYINIDKGRQLFVDNFLIDSTTLTVDYKKAETRTMPLFQKTTAANGKSAVLTSGGVWYDMDEKIYKMWYQINFAGKMAYAESKDGVHWRFPAIEGSTGNLVLNDPTGEMDWRAAEGEPNKGPTKDGDSYISNIAGSCVWIDYNAEPAERYKMMIRQRDVCVSMDGGAWLLVSADGKNWTRKENTSPEIVTQQDTNAMGDRSTFYYNELLDKWVFSIRHGIQRAKYGILGTTLLWQDDDIIRARVINEGKTWLEAATWTKEEYSRANPTLTTLPWYNTDQEDVNTYLPGVEAQIYNLDSIAYESITLGMFQMWYGPENDDLNGWPKITEIQAGYSRDGYYYERPVRGSGNALINASREEGAWDYGYLSTSAGGVIVLDDEIRIYYSALSGQIKLGNGDVTQDAHTGGSISYATLRRDGFASMKGTGDLLTKKLTVTKDAKYLFVNADIEEGGSLKAEILDADGNVVKGYTADDCVAFTGDSCCQKITWNGSDDLSMLVGKGFRIRFVMENGELYSFWLSTDEKGTSDGATAAGYAGELFAD